MRRDSEMSEKSHGIGIPPPDLPDVAELIQSGSPSESVAKGLR
jgi:hypothetical protein